MAIDGDHPTQAIPVTRALKRSRGRWRIFAFIALAVAVLAGFARLAADFPGAQGPSIARVAISGTITSDRERTAFLRELAEDDSVAAVIVSINSGGGTSAGGEELYHSLRQLALAKPVVATIAETGASAAYMAAIAAERVFARNLSIVGSIGVFYQHIDASGLLDTIGIDLDMVPSGPLKGRPGFDEPITPEVRQSLQALVDSSYDYFVDLVAQHRDLSRPQTLALADGRILSGADGIAAGLIDEAGGEAEALAWLAASHEIDPALAIDTVWPRATAPNWIDLLLSRATAALLGESGGLPLDGLISLWHPSNS